jgi:hypothetical protein
VDALSNIETFGWGCVGGTIAFVAIFALPEVRAAWKEKDFNFSLRGALVVVGLLALQAALGGAVAVLVGDATLAKQAIAYGVGAEGIVGGYIKGAT